MPKLGRVLIVAIAVGLFAPLPAARAGPLCAGLAAGKNAGLAVCRFVAGGQRRARRQERRQAAASCAACGSAACGAP